METRRLGLGPGLSGLRSLFPAPCSHGPRILLVPRPGSTRDLETAVQLPWMRIICPWCLTELLKCGTVCSTSPGVESRTHGVALVQSRQDKVHQMKWSCSRQPRRLPVGRDTLVQEGSRLRHAGHSWPGDTPKMSAHVDRAAVSAEWDHP